MKIYTMVGTSLRIVPDKKSAIVKTFVQKDIELELVEKTTKDGDAWFLVKDESNKGWVKHDFVKKIYEDD